MARSPRAHLLQSPRYYGDSRIFARRVAFEACGDIPHVPIIENVVFVEKLERTGRIA